MNWEAATSAIALASLICPGLILLAFKIGRIEERMVAIKEGHDAVVSYAHSTRHDIVERVQELQLELERLKPKPDII